MVLLSWICLFVFGFNTGGNCYSYNESLFYAGLSNSLAHYFESACIYFLTDSRNEDSIFLENVIKLTSGNFQQSTNVYSFDEYYINRHERKIAQCYIPLQVIISHDEATRLAFANYSQKTEMHGSDSGGGGIWLIFLDSLNGPDIEAYFEGIKTPFDAEIIISELRSNHKMDLKEVYRVSDDRPLRYPRFGRWTERGLRTPRKSLLYSRRSNLEQLTMNVGYVESAPFSYMTTENGKEVLQGYAGDIWRQIEKTINVTTKYKQKQNYGVFNGSQWNGLIGSVSRNLLDVGVSDIAYTQKRFEFISYSMPLMISTFQIYLQSRGTSLEADALFMPLGYDIWASLLAWLFLSALVLYFGCYISDENLNTTENLSFQTALFFVGGALCGQGGANIPQRFTCRVFFIASFLITTVVFPSYSASLLSFLTVSPQRILFRNLAEFYDLGYMKMSVKYSSYDYDIFAYDTDPKSPMNRIFSRDIKHLAKNQFPQTLRQAIKNVCKDKNLAYFGLNDAVSWALQEEEKSAGSKWSCQITTVPFDAGKVSVGMAFPKNSHFRGLINHHLYGLPAPGMLKRLRQLHWPYTRPIKLEEQPAVGFDNVFMMFVILGTGIVISLIFLTAEIYLGSKKSNRKRKTKALWHRMVRLTNKQVLTNPEVLCPNALSQRTLNLQLDSMYYYY